MDMPPIKYARTADGVSIAYYVLGEGPPVIHVFPHVVSHLTLGWQVPAQRNFIQRLSERMTVIGFDWRGCGLSGPLGPELSLETLLADIAALIERFSLKRVSFCVWAQATMPVLAFAARFPERVSRLAIGEASVGDSELNRTLVRLGTSNPGLEGQAKVALIAGMNEPEDLVPLSELHRESSHTAASRLFWQLLNTTDVDSLAAKVQAPALFIHAKDDALMPLATTQSMVARMPNAVLRVVGGYSPNSIQRDPDAVSAMVDFLATAPNDEGRLTPTNTLSAREVEVLALIAAGRSNQQIADELVISVNTVLRHVTNILTKTESSNRAEATSYAHRNGLV